MQRISYLATRNPAENMAYFYHLIWKNTCHFSTWKETFKEGVPFWENQCRQTNRHYIFWILTAQDHSFVIKIWWLEWNEMMNSWELNEIPYVISLTRHCQRGGFKWVVSCCEFGIYFAILTSPFLSILMTSLQKPQARQ